MRVKYLPVSKKRDSKLHNSLLYEYLTLAVIVATGIALRFWHLQFYLDNGGLDSMYYVLAAVKYSNGDFFTRSVTLKGPFFTFMLALSMKIFGPTFMATRFVSLVAGSLLIVVTFLLGSELFDKKTGLLSALIVSCNPLLIFYHGLVYREAVFSFTWTAFIYFALRGFKGKTLFSIIGGIFFVLSSFTISLGLFAGIGLVLYLLLEMVFKSEQTLTRYKNLDKFFFAAFLTLAPFIVKNYLTYKDPFIQWLFRFQYPTKAIFESIMWICMGLMAFSPAWTRVLKALHVQAKLPKWYSLSSSIKLHPRTIKICIVTFLVVIAMSVFMYEFSKGLGESTHFTRIVLGLVKLLETLALPESLGFLLVFSVAAIVYTLKTSRDVALVISAFAFSAPGLAWGVIGNYMSRLGLGFYEILIYYPNDPLQNSFRYVSSYISLLSVFACGGIFLLSDNFARMLGRYHERKARKTRMLKTAVVLILTLIFVLQFIYADALLITKARRDSFALEQRYGSALEWLSSKGSPPVYGFNPKLKEQYGQNKVVLLTKETLMGIALRASDERIEFVISDVFGDYSEAQLALFFAGLEDQSPVSIDSFQLVKSYKSWPRVQIFKINIVEPNRTALVVQHEDWGEEWVSFLSESYLVDAVNDEEDLTPHFSREYKLVVLTEIKRPLTDVELKVLQQKVANGAILILNGLSPAYVDLEKSGYWIGATKFTEAPKDAKWNVKFTENARAFSAEIDLNKNYGLYSSSNYSSPTGLAGIGDDVVVYATRVEDGAAAIFAKPFANGVVIFSGIRHGYATTAEDYSVYVSFIQSLLEKANDETLFT